MNKLVMGCGVFMLVGVIFVLSAFGFVIGSVNREATLRSSIEAQENYREASYDNMKKVINQQAQLPPAARKDLEKLLPLVVSGRSGGSVFKSVQEKYPEFNMPLYMNLSRTIESERNSFLTAQEKLFDLKAQHDSLRRSAVSGTVLTVFGRNSEIKVKVISSDDAKAVVQSGTDNDTKLNLE